MKFTFYLIKSFLKASSDELLQKHEVSIDHEEFMTERYTLIFGSSSLVPPRSLPHEYSPPIPPRPLPQEYSSSISPRPFASSPPPLPVNQPIKHFQSENQVFSSLAMNQSIKHLQSKNQVSPSLATPQGSLIIDNSDHVLITEISEHPDKRPDGPSTPPTSVNQSIEQPKGQSSMRHSPRESSIARNFLRQSSSSSQSENSYIRQPPPENSYTRLSENSYTFIIHRRCGIE